MSSLEKVDHSRARDQRFLLFCGGTPGPRDPHPLGSVPNFANTFKIATRYQLIWKPECRSY